MWHQLFRNLCLYVWWKKKKSCIRSCLDIKRKPEVKRFPIKARVSETGKHERLHLKLHASNDTIEMLCSRVAQLGNRGRRKKKKTCTESNIFRLEASLANAGKNARRVGYQTDHRITDGPSLLHGSLFAATQIFPYSSDELIFCEILCWLFSPGGSLHFWSKEEKVRQRQRRSQILNYIYLSFERQRERELASRSSKLKCAVVATEA